MVAATYTSDLTDIFLWESTTGVTAFGGGASGLGASPDYAIEGANAVDKQVSAAEKGFLYDNVSNFTIGADDHFYIWINLAVYGLAATRNNRGIAACIGDDASNFVQFHVNGSDTLPAGGIQPYAIRFANTALTNFRTLTGTPGTTPSQIGASANVTGANNNISDVVNLNAVSVRAANSAGLIQTVSGSGLSAAQATQLDELWKLQGLDISVPMTVTPTSRSSGGVSQTISGDGETTTTVTRDP